VGRCRKNLGAGKKFQGPDENFCLSSLVAIALKESRQAIVPGASTRNLEIQRQIDFIRKDFSDLYSPKDALSNMQRRIDDLERQLRRLPPRSS